MEKAEKYDRALQLEILNQLIDVAPGHLTDEQEQELIGKFQDYDHFVACMLYLQMHGLVSRPFVVSESNEGVNYIFNSHTCAITHDGIDFLLDDGGLSAILKVQTIRLHNDTIIAIEDLIALSNLTEPEKASVVSKLRELPADAIKHLTLQLLTQGVLQLPNAVQLIQKFLQKG
ncbi:hypothetical protein WB66_05340 [bacteria symbiont BFo1 of Frankliniella occidentalis]|nr:hypothetical protein AI28_07035 [bacteria symbiont BFo1 of Frankliniella occidentalis]KYP85825.1 hypothetical protein WB66_05340 [bacteria symbiont BFo1 of Frankliniella occidentalis]